MDSVLHDKLNPAVWAAHSLFQRGKTAGSSVNMSFRHNDPIYISVSGSCFGIVSEEDLIVTSLDGIPASGKKPSEEWPPHLALYEKSEDIGAVIHTHSTYSVLWTFVPDFSEHDCVPDYTPYLKMKLGTVGLVPYEKSGSDVLFAAFRERIHENRGYLLRNHGLVVPGKTIMDAFYCLKELEESVRAAWELYWAGLHHLQRSLRRILPLI